MIEAIRRLIAGREARGKSSPAASLCRGYLTLFDAVERPATALIPSQWLDGLEGGRVSINDGSERPMKDGLKLLGKTSLANLESFLVFNDLDALVFAASSCPRIGRGVFEMTWIAADPAAEFMNGGPLDDLAGHGQLHYGYCRRLGLDMSPLSESKVHKSLLGATSVRVDAAKQGWLSGRDDVKAGAVRGLYPINYWSTEALMELKALGIVWPADLQVGVGLNRIDAAAQLLIESGNPALRRFMRFGST